MLKKVYDKKFKDVHITVYDTGMSTAIFEGKPKKVRVYIISAEGKGKKDLFRMLTVSSGGYIEAIIIYGFFSESKPLVMKPSIKVRDSEFVKDLDNFFYSISLSEGITQKIVQLVYGFSLIAAFIFTIYYYYKIGEIKKEEFTATSLEAKIDEQIFSKLKNVPLLEEYASLKKAIETVLQSNTIHGVLIYGKPGTGKTFAVRRILYENNVRPVYYKGGTVSLFDFVKILYVNRRNKVIVFDDFDTALKDEDFINVLKSATDTYPQRVISVPRSSTVASEGGEILDIPQKFVFTSKIILITNKSENDLPLPLRSRMITIKIDFPNEKMIDVIKKTINVIRPDIPEETKLQILDELTQIVKGCNKKGVRVDFRTFSAALDLYIVYGNEWKRVIKESLCGA